MSNPKNFGEFFKHVVYIPFIALATKAAINRSLKKIQLYHKWLIIFTVIPFGSFTKNRLTPQGSLVIG